MKKIIALLSKYELLIIIQTFYQIMFYFAYICLSSKNGSETVLMWTAYVFSLFFIINITINEKKCHKKKKNLIPFIFMFIHPLIQSILYKFLIDRIIGSKIIIGELSTHDFLVFYIVFLVLSGLAFGVFLIWETKVLEIYEKNYKKILLLLYLVCGMLFAIIYFVIDQNVGGVFSFNNDLKSRIQYDNLCSLVENDQQQEFVDKYEHELKNIISEGKEKIWSDSKEYVLYNENCKVANTNIGRDIAMIFYDTLANNYNKYYIADIYECDLSNMKYQKNMVIFDDISNTDNTQKYIIVKMILYKDNEYIPESKYQMITYQIPNKNSKENTFVLPLVYDIEDYYSCKYIYERREQYIFLDWLCSSHTLPDRFPITFDNAEFSRNIWDYVYYSFVVLTTLGFGDMTPVIIQVRILTIVESVLGLVFMGMFLAKILDKPLTTE